MSNDADHVFRKIELPATFLASERQNKVIKADWLKAAHRRQRAIEAAERHADDIVAEARLQAEFLKESTKLAAEKEYAQKLEGLESEAAAQLDKVGRYLGDAVAISVESIFRTIFESDPTMLIKATTAIARHVLEQEIGCSIYVNVNDRDDQTIQALEERFAVQSSHQVTRGGIHIRCDSGDVKVDARKLIRDLGKDLRQCFRQVGNTVDT